MLKTLEKHWTLISILLILVILAALLFWPGISRSAGILMLVVSIGFVIAFAVAGQVRAYRQGRIDGLALLRNIALDLAGILLTMAAAVFAGRWAAAWATPLAAQAAAQFWPGTQAPVGVVAGLLAALLVGFAAGFVVQSIWGRLAKPKAPAAKDESGQ